MAAFLHQNIFPCVSCGAHFAIRDEQVAHLQGVHGADQPWLCYHCPTATKDLESLKEHQKIHGKGFNQCHCGLQLPTADMMARHQKFDHQEQQLRAVRGCERCGYVNDSRVAVSLHMLHQHWGKCDYCLEVFTDDVDLRVHKNQGYDGVCPTKIPERSIIAPNSHVALSALPPAPPTDTPLTSEPGSPTHQHTDAPLQLDQLPDFATIPQAQNMHGVRAEDFNPTRVYKQRTPHPLNYRYCPPQVSDSRLLNADPRMLAYGNLLRLAKSMTNEEIMKKANQYRPEPVFRNKKIVESRIQAAFREEARIFTDASRGLYTEPEEVATWLENERRKNGIVNEKRMWPRSVNGGQGSSMKGGGS